MQLPEMAYGEGGCCWKQKITRAVPAAREKSSRGLIVSARSPLNPLIRKVEERFPVTAESFRGADRLSSAATSASPCDVFPAADTTLGPGARACEVPSQKVAGRSGERKSQSRTQCRV